MKTKRLFSLLLMCAMVFTSIPISAIADTGGLLNPTQKAKMELLLMDYDPGVTDATIGKPLNKGKIHEITPEQIPASGEFLVAIKIGDLERIKEGNKGIYSANVTVKFDPMYLDVEPLANLKGKAQPRVGENKIYNDSLDRKSVV